MLEHWVGFCYIELLKACLPMWSASGTIQPLISSRKELQQKLGQTLPCPMEQSQVYAGVVDVETALADEEKSEKTMRGRGRGTAAKGKAKAETKPKAKPKAKARATAQAVCNAQPEMITLHVQTSKPSKANRKKLWLEDVISMIEHSAAAYGL